MPRFLHAIRSAVAAGLLLPAAAAGAAELPRGERPAAAFSWTRSTGLLSDYRYRGLSYSGLGPAAQAGVAVAHASGLYAFADGSTVRFGGKRDVEVSGGAGWSGQVGAVGEIDVSVSYAAYADHAATDLLEASLGWRRPIGPVTPFATVAYAPAQTPLRGGGGRLARNLYVQGGAEWALRGTPLTLRAQLGREQGSAVPLGGAKWDWQLVTSVALGKLEFGVAYVDTALTRFDPDLRRAGKRGLVVTANAGF